jgi:diguanylate cyclase (GGDEF)-like protein
MPDLKNLANRLFKIVFSWYLLLAILVTGVQLGIEYASIKNTIASDLVALGRSFAPGVSDAMWTYDRPLLDSLTMGIAQTAIITGVKLEKENGEAVSVQGNIPAAGEPASDALLAPFQMLVVPLQSTALASSHPAHALGQMTLYSDRSVVLERVKNSFVVILINSIIKTAGLWLIFYWAITWRLSRPLTELSDAVANLDARLEEGDPVLIEYPHRDEIGALVASLNDMRVRLSASHRELERKVAERTRELEEANRRLEALSTTDGLTGIANRRRFDEVLKDEWNRALRVRQPLALLMLDIDLFKNYNDRYGHQAGDECLRSVGRILEANSRRSSDLAARYGGEEFVLLASHTDTERAMHLANVVRESIESLELTHADAPQGKVTVSIGVAVLQPGNRQRPELLITKADEALYCAKNAGRNRVMLAGSC